MKSTWVIQMCKNAFDVSNGIIILTFHRQDLTKGCGRGMHRPGPANEVIFSTGRDGPEDERWFFYRAGPANERRFFQRAGPANDRRFFQRAGPGRQMKDDFSNGLVKEKLVRVALSARAWQIGPCRPLSGTQSDTFTG